jgi:hypothetical protein
MLLLVIPPLALITNIVAVVIDKSKAYAIVGLVISALTCFLYFLAFIASMIAHGD